jgi:hypothetical protein
MLLLSFCCPAQAGVPLTLVVSVNIDFYCSFVTLFLLGVLFPVILLVFLFHGDLAPYARIEEETQEAKSKRMKRSLKKNKSKRVPRPVKKKHKKYGNSDRRGRTSLIAVAKRNEKKVKKMDPSHLYIVS